METLKFTDYDDFVDRVVDEYDYIKRIDSNYNAVTVLAKYEDAKEILWYLIMNHRYGINSIQIADPIVNGYEDEYSISIMDDEIWCEPAKRDTGYLYTMDDSCFVLGDCNSALLSKIHSTHVYEVDMQGDVECDDCAECSCCDRKEIFKVNGKEVAKEEYEKKLEHMESVLNDYLDEMNKWRNLLDW